MNQPDLLLLFARVLLVALFVMTGWQKLTDFAGTVAYMRTTPTPVPAMSAGIAIAVEFFCGVAIVLGLEVRPLAIVFCVFTIGTAFLGHRYWRLEGEQRHANLLNFYKNVSIAGGFLLLALAGPGKYAVVPG